MEDTCLFLSLSSCSTFFDRGCPKQSLNICPDLPAPASQFPMQCKAVAKKAKEMHLRLKIATSTINIQQELPSPNLLSKKSQWNEREGGGEVTNMMGTSPSSSCCGNFLAKQLFFFLPASLPLFFGFQRERKLRGNFTMSYNSLPLSLSLSLSLSEWVHKIESR